MAPLSYKHKFKNFEGKVVSIVEEGISKERVDFIKDLLEFNGFEVIVEEVKAKDEESSVKFNVYVPDPMFNPLIWIYDRKLKTKDGRYVTHEYWEKQDGETKPQYWEKCYK
jgi:hypothetical protein